MELRQLRYFLSVADMKSFTRAADVMHIAQSALSRQIRKLEDELGVALLYRNGRTATLTEAGRRFYDHGKLMFRQLDDAKRALVEQQEDPTGSVTFGYPPHLGPQFPVSVISRFRARYPNAQLRIVEGFSNQLADWLFTGRLDAALLYNASSHKHLATEFTLTEDLFAIGPPGDATTAGDNVDLSCLVGLPVITPATPSATRTCVEEAMARAGVALCFTLEVDSLLAIKRLVAAGHGYARPLYGRSDALTDKLILLIREEVDRSIEEGLWLASPGYAPQLSLRPTNTRAMPTQYNC